MAQETTKIYKWTIGDIDAIKDGPQIFNNDVETDVKLSLVLHKPHVKSTGHRCCECENIITTEKLISLYILFESAPMLKFSTSQKFKPLKLTISITTFDEETLFTKEKISLFTDENKKKFGFCHFMLHNVFSSYFSDHMISTPLKIICKLENISRSLSEIVLSTQINCTTSFKSLLNNETLSDVTLNIKDELKIPAHKMILYARSAYFERMFSHNNVENTSNEVKVDFEYEPFWQVLKYIYCQEIEKLDTLAIEIFKIAHYYQIEDLQLICQNFLKNNLMQEKNVIEVLKLSDDYDVEDLKDYCIDLLIQKFDMLEINEDSLLEFFHLKPKLGYKLFLHQQDLVAKK